MSSLIDKNVLLGVSGGIAAYKSADLVRRLRDAGAHVRVIMTAAAEEFVRPLTFQAVSGEPVHSSLLDPDAEAAMGHIELARWADVLLVAPASADVMARFRHGLAGDLLSTVYLATEAPVALAPAMNRVMWAHPATRENAAALSTRGVHLFGPGQGDQACGEVGAGRMLEPLELVTRLAGVFAEPVLAGRRVLLTAGPTREPLDPVRYITNRSSGKMGFALAAVAAAAGAEVTLVAGPCALPTPAGVHRIDVETAEQMYAEVQRHVAGQDVFIGCAAVADYRPAEAVAGKIKRSGADLKLHLVPNPDILAAVAARAEDRPFTVGFAAETDRVLEHASDKRRRKGLDLIAANRVGPGLGFDTDDNQLELIWDGGHRQLGPGPKSALAAELITQIAQCLQDDKPEGAAS
ncbi:phosphopantothenoylcysteine decarboxylase/phosphopantothenate--cysteine ligase [Natronocella acetinitrilica]|uniref:Coenzyme A biosynthesis bifunctional protein CoaBC n=1 Tax=Natronocella acetinitrilica TaxID=414046 RepID=A0AAE3G3A7_9GAMM|nr:bifunctional phosphopantothenoylcysteine decarboxylase/phosphopantothenate--cysteine ligase CoaBC [Natronocella acetinitrilica]MCP1673122.1 phosphopantothenoylcysteine decarboxylase/phosphopantothenate--cysteine ligase [Natronocella acetinitrilica]